MKIKAEVENARMMMENALQHPGILKKLENIGYLPKHILEGKALLGQLILLQNLQQEEYGAKYEATQTLEADMAILKDVFMKHLTLARLAFDKDRAKQHILGLNEPRAKTRTAWVAQVLAFYEGILAEQKTMVKYGVSKPELEQAKAQAEALLGSRHTQIQKKGDAQQATAQRNAALKALRLWIRDFKAILKIALRGDEQLLEVVGIVTVAS